MNFQRRFLKVNLCMNFQKRFRKLNIEERRFLCINIKLWLILYRKKRIKSLEQDVKELHDVIDGRIKVIDELKRQRSEISKENALLREENDTLKTRYLSYNVLYSNF